MSLQICGSTGGVDAAGDFSTAWVRKNVSNEYSRHIRHWHSLKTSIKLVPKCDLINRLHVVSGENIRHFNKKALLVGGFNLPLWKIMDFVSWDFLTFPTEWKVITAMFQTTTQFWYHSLKNLPTSWDPSGRSPGCASFRRGTGLTWKHGMPYRSWFPMCLTPYPADMMKIDEICPSSNCLWICWNKRKSPFSEPNLGGEYRVKIWDTLKSSVSWWCSACI